MLFCCGPPPAIAEVVYEGVDVFVRKSEGLALLASQARVLAFGLR